MKWTLVPIPQAFSPSMTAARSIPSRSSREPDDEQVPGVRAVRRVGGELDEVGDRRRRQALDVSASERAAGLEKLLGTLQLDDPERRGEIGQVVLVAGVLDLVEPRACRGVAVPCVRLMPWRDMSRGRSAIASSSVTSIPPSPVRDRLGRVERVGADRPEPAGELAVRAADRGSETRGRRPRRPRRRARRGPTSPSISIGRPADVDATTAFVRGVTAARIASGVAFRVAASTSTSTGCAPPIGDDLGARRERPGRDDHLVAASTPSASRARCSAAVAEFRARAWRAPMNSANGPRTAGSARRSSASRNRGPRGRLPSRGR